MSQAIDFNDKVQVIWQFGAFQKTKDTFHTHTSARVTCMCVRVYYIYYLFAKYTKTSKSRA